MKDWITNKWWDFREAIARWVPDPGQGNGFGRAPQWALDSDTEDKLSLTLEVEGRRGVSFISREMWEVLGRQKGWL